MPLALLSVAMICAMICAMVCAMPCAVRADRVDDLIRGLNSADVAKRADAAQALAKEKSRRAIPALIKAMGDSVESVRSQALRAAADTIAVSRPDLNLATAALRDPNAFRRAGAAELLGIFPDKRNVKALTRATHDLNAQVRAAAGGALGQIGDPDSAVSLRILLSDKSSIVRSKAVVALGIMRDRACVKQLVALLHDKDRSIQVNCAVALARIGDQGVVPDLISMANSPKSGGPFGMRFYAAYALGALGDRRAIPVLIQGLQDKDKFVRSSAAQAFGQLHESSALPTANKGRWLIDKNELVRWCAAQALGTIGDRRAVKPLIAGLKRQERRCTGAVRKGARQDLRSMAAVKPLIAAFGDDDEAIPKLRFWLWENWRYKCVAGCSRSLKTQ